MAKVVIEPRGREVAGNELINSYERAVTFGNDLLVDFDTAAILDIRDEISKIEKTLSPSLLDLVCKIDATFQQRVAYDITHIENLPRDNTARAYLLSVLEFLHKLATVQPNENWWYTQFATSEVKKILSANQ